MNNNVRFVYKMMLSEKFYKRIVRSMTGNVEKITNIELCRDMVRGMIKLR